jgi:hypothetical protein
MNIFTRFLAQFGSDDDFDLFVNHWDRLERLILRVYKQAKVDENDVNEWNDVRGWLSENYPRWEVVLEPFWQDKLVGGKVADVDPFGVLIMPAFPQHFINNWKALQTLPAAREALNNYLVQN